MATRYIGTCPVCEGQQRLHKLTMVHHGYRRPGYGQIVGDCFGVGFPPYELSTEGTEAYLVAVLAGIANNGHALDELRAPDLASVTVRQLRRPGWSRGEYEDVVYTPADGHKFRDAVQSKIRAVERSQEQLRDEQRRCERLIRDWVKRPVRTEEEDMARKSQETAERRAVLDAARAVRQAKRDAISAKNFARVQERQDLIEHYREVFQRLAGERSEGADRAAKAEWAQMQRRKAKKAYLDFDEPDLDIDAALLALGLAKPNPRAYGKWQHLYANDFGVLY